MYVVSKQARKSNLKKKYIEKRVYRALKVAYPVGSKVRKGPKHISVSIKPITQETKSMNTKAFFIYTKYTYKT